LAGGLLSAIAGGQRLVVVVVGRPFRTLAPISLIARMLGGAEVACGLSGGPSPAPASAPAPPAPWATFFVERMIRLLAIDRRPSFGEVVDRSGLEARLTGRRFVRPQRRGVVATTSATAPAATAPPTTASRAIISPGFVSVAARPVFVSALFPMFQVVVPTTSLVVRPLRAARLVGGAKFRAGLRGAWLCRAKLRGAGLGPPRFHGTRRFAGRRQPETRIEVVPAGSRAGLRGSGGGRPRLRALLRARRLGGRGRRLLAFRLGAERISEGGPGIFFFRHVQSGGVSRKRGGGGRPPTLDPRE